MSDPQQDSNDVRPSSLRHLVGQEQVRQVVSTALDYTFQEQTSFPHALALGGPGLGKTAIARVIATELASTCHEVLASAISSPAEFFAVLMKAQDLDVIFIDEIHCLESQYQHTLLIALDERRIYLPNTTGGPPQSINLGRYSLIAATTDEHLILKPLADRFKLILRFSYYSITELSEIIRQRAKALGWPIDEDVPPLIAQRSKGVPRLGIRMLQSCWRVCRATGHHEVTTKHLARACELEQIDPLGLDATEQQYLLCLSEQPLRLNVLSSLLGLPAKTISAVTESYLIRSGLITKDRQGVRMLTAKGMEHVGRKHGDKESSND